MSSRPHRSVRSRLWSRCFAPGVPARDFLVRRSAKGLDPHVTSWRIVVCVGEHLTVGRVAGLAGVTVRTLHHYDEIGLVRPSARTGAGYRAYSAGDVERLREVLAYRRLGFGLREVAELVSDPSADAVVHLRRLRGLLLEPRGQAEPTRVGHLTG